MSIWNPGSELTEEQKRILRNKKLEANRPPAALLELLGPLADYDRDADRARSRLGWTAIVFCLVTVAAAFGALQLGFSIASIVALALLAAAAITAIVLWSRLISLDLSNNLRAFALPVLALLSEDMEPSEAVRIRLDLSSCTAKEKLTSKSEPYRSGAYHKVVDTFYLDPWMEGEAVLADGSRLSWSVTDRIREQNKTKRNPRGKIKTKKKHTKKSVMNVRVELPGGSYEVAAPGQADVNVGSKRNVFKLSDTVKSSSLEPISPWAFVDLVAGAYGRVAPIRRPS